MSEPKDFISVYKWDSYCQKLYDRIYGKLSHMNWELGELYDQHPMDPLTLLYYYQKWHYNKELYQATQKDEISRKYVIEKMLQRGYGVNIDLAGFLGTIESNDLPEINRKLGETFYKELDIVKSLIFMPEECILNYDSPHIISELCQKLEYPLEKNIPHLQPPCPEILNFPLFFKFKERVSPNITLGVFQKMFFTLAETSKTIMKGTIGYENYYPPQYLKTIARDNFLNLFREILTTSPDTININLDLLKRIHYLLYSGLDTPYTCRPGEFRTFDFDDKNGVTVEEGKLIRELLVLEGYMQRIDWNTGAPYALIKGLAEIYHLIIAIHPFSDANGRVGKCFVNYIMLVHGLMPIIFDDEEEILSLPRYGSSLLDIEAYFKNRIEHSIHYYIKEIQKIEKSGNLNKKIYNIYFDSGFHFRHYIDGLIEVNFTAYVINNINLAEEYIEQCRIVFPDEHSLYKLIIYCGLCRWPGCWEREMTVTSHNIEVIDFSKPDKRIYEVTFYLSLYLTEEFTSIEFSVVSSLTGQVFNNKDLNYSYKIICPN